MHKINYEISLIYEDERWRQFSRQFKWWVKKISGLVFKYTKISLYLETVELSILLTDNKKLHELNKAFMGKDKPTNILSFPNYDVTNHNLLKIVKANKHFYIGDIAISYDKVLKESTEQNKLFQEHLFHLLVHGILHLLGYDHIIEEDAIKMEALEIQILAEMNIKSPYDL